MWLLRLTVKGVDLMPYQEKRAVVNIALECAMFAAYCAYAWNRFAAIGIAADDLKSWDLMTLAFIGIGVAAAVVTRIFFHILLSMGIAVKRRYLDDRAIGKVVEAEITEDEMDKLIELKSMKAGFSASGMGFVAALTTLAFDLPGSVMLNVLFLSFQLGALTERALSIYYYRGV